MKHIFLLFLFLPFIAISQREVAADSTYIQQANGLFFHVNVKTFTDLGPSQVSPTLLGDTASLISYYANKTVTEAQIVSNAAVLTMGITSVSRMIRQWSASVFSLTGRNTLSEVQASIEAPFLSGSWVIQNGTATSVSINKNAQGVLRYTVQGSSAKTIETLGQNWIVLKNYPSSPTDTHLFRVSGNRWSNIGRTIIFRK